MKAARLSRETCLVTGGCGFLGSHVARRLLAEGYPVRILDRTLSRKRGGARCPAGAELIPGSLEDDELVAASLQGCRYLFHFASSMVPATAHAARNLNENLVLTVNLLEAAVTAGVRKVIYPSSGGAIYGIPRHVPVPESAPTDPISSYGVVKLAIEKYLALYHRQSGMRYVALRYSNPIGEGQQPKPNFGVVAAFFHAVATGRPIEIWGDGDSVKDFLYVGDAVEAAMAGLRYDGDETVFNIGSGEGTSLRELATLVRETAGVDAPVLHREARPNDVPKVILDIRAARKELGWEPRVGLREALKRTWATFEVGEAPRLTALNAAIGHTAAQGISSTGSGPVPAGSRISRTTLRSGSDTT